MIASGNQTASGAQRFKPGPFVHYVYEDAAYVDIGAHVFPVDKYRLTGRWLREELFVPPDRMHGWLPVNDEQLERVHTPGYLRDLREARSSWATLSSELPVTRSVIDGFRAMVGGSVAAATLAIRHGVGFHVGGGFHHAFPDHAEGFCYLHDVAIAIEQLRADGECERVLVVDTDVHQGNGTAIIYAQDADTFTYSIHQENNYPVKQRSDLDRGLDDGIEDEAYLEHLQRDLVAIAERFEPDFVAYVAGVDPHRDDQLGGLALTDEGLGRRDRLVFDRYVGAGIPVGVFLAGGYAPSADATARLHLGTAMAAEDACERALRDLQPPS